MPSYKAPRLILALLLLSLSLSPTAPSSAQGGALCAGEEPCDDVIVPAERPRMSGAQVVATAAGLEAAWTPPVGQALVCAVRTTGPDAPLEPCHLGHGGRHTFATPRDAGLLVRPGDAVEIRAYDARGALIGVAVVVVAAEWRTWLPRVEG